MPIGRRRIATDGDARPGFFASIDIAHYLFKLLFRDQRPGMRGWVQRGARRPERGGVGDALDYLVEDRCVGKQAATRNADLA